MSYRMGIDLGVVDVGWATDERVGRSAPTLVHGIVGTSVGAAPDGSLLAGAALVAAGGAVTAVVSGFVELLGSSEPVMVGATPYGPEALVGALIHACLAEAVARHGSAPAAVTIVHDPALDQYRSSLLAEAARLAGLRIDDVFLAPRDRVRTEAPSAATAAASGAAIGWQIRPEPTEDEHAGVSTTLAALGGAGVIGAAALLQRLHGGASLPTAGAAGVPLGGLPGPTGSPLGAGPAGSPLGGGPVAGPAGSPLGGGPAAGPAGSPLGGGPVAGPVGSPLGGAPAAGPVGSPLGGAPAAGANAGAAMPPPPGAVPPAPMGSGPDTRGPRSPGKVSTPGTTGVAWVKPVAIFGIVALAAVGIGVVAFGGDDGPSDTPSAEDAAGEVDDRGAADEAAAGGGGTAASDPTTTVIVTTVAPTTSTTAAPGIDLTPLLGTFWGPCEPYIPGDGASKGQWTISQQGPDRLTLTAKGFAFTDVGCTSTPLEEISVDFPVTLHGVTTVGDVTVYQVDGPDGPDGFGIDSAGRLRLAVVGSALGADGYPVEFLAPELAGTRA